MYFEPVQHRHLADSGVAEVQNAVRKIGRLVLGAARIPRGLYIGLGGAWDCFQ